MANIPNRACDLIRTRVSLGVRRSFKRLPGMVGRSERSHPQGDCWMPVRFAPGLERTICSQRRSIGSPTTPTNRSRSNGSSTMRNWGSPAWMSGAHRGLLGTHCRTRRPVGIGPHLRALLAFAGDHTEDDGEEPPRRSSDDVRVADETDGGTVELFASEGTSEASLYRHRTRPATITVPRIPLDVDADRARLDRIDVIMMDIEGAEERARHGAASVLKRHSPKLLLEVHGRKSVWSLEVLGAHGCRITTFRGCPVSAETFPDSILQVVATRDA